MRRRRLTSQRGVSLIETLVALGLLAIGAGTMGNFLVQQIRFSESNYVYTQAYALAEDQLESLRALPYEDMVTTGRIKKAGGVNYILATNVQPNTPASGLKLVTVSVFWASPQGAKNVAVQTIYTAVQR